MPPELYPEAVGFFDAFLDLSPSRSEGGVLLTEIKAYIDMCGHLGCDAPGEFIQIIRGCDAAFLKARAEKNG